MLKTDHLSPKPQATRSPRFDFMCSTSLVRPSPLLQQPYLQLIEATPYRQDDHNRAG